MDKARLVSSLRGLARESRAWTDFASAADEELRRAIPFDASCWHTVDPGTVLFTGSLNRDVSCSGSWLAEHEYVIEDVTKWSYLAHSGRLAGAVSIATHGDLSRSARHRSHTAIGFGDELRGSFVDGDGYWAAVGLLRAAGRPWFTEAEVALLTELSAVLAEGARRTLVSETVTRTATVDGPGVVVLDAQGRAESITPAAETWIAELSEDPPPDVPAESKIVQAVAARARSAAGIDPLQAGARARVRTRGGSWLLLYGSPLSGENGRTAVVIQPAMPAEVAPLVALAYGLSPRECAVTRLCIEGRSTKEIAAALNLSAYTVQDHLKSIFEKTGVHSRGELVGQVFLEHYIPRWHDVAGAPPGWAGYEIS